MTTTLRPRGWTTTILICLGCAAPVTVLRAQPAAPAREQQPRDIPITGRVHDETKPIDDALLAFLREHDVPGAAVAITRRGKLVYSRGFGHADPAKREPVQPHSLFRIASISKPITGVAVLQLVERGQLKFDDRVFDILKIEPYFANEDDKPDPRLKQITIRHLLHHTAGYDRGRSFDPMFRPVTIATALNVAPPAQPQHTMRYMAGRPLDFDPGARYAYSNFGYCLLGRVIETKTGQTYEAYVKQHVLKPLGVTTMRLGRTRLEGRAKDEVRYISRRNPKRSSVFEKDLRQQVPSPYGGWNLEAMDAHGGWIASAVDLVRFASAFDEPSKCPVLNAASIKTMFAKPDYIEQFDNDAGRDAKHPRHYGCGWMVRDYGDAGFNAWHTGGLDGTSTLLVRRHDGYCWAVLFNMDVTAKKNWLAGEIDPIMHRAVDAVKTWPGEQ